MWFLPIIENIEKVSFNYYLLRTSSKNKWRLYYKDRRDQQ